MPKLSNLDAVPHEYVDDPEFETPMMTKRLGALAGSERLYVNIDYVKPGGKSVKYHAHSLQEEFFLILSGHGRVRFQGEDQLVKKGDFLAKPAGRGIAHQFINDGNEILEILDCGTNDRSDVVEYPDENVFLVKDKGLIFNGSEAIKDWSSDPNE